LALPLEILSVLKGSDNGRCVPDIPKGLLPHVPKRDWKQNARQDRPIGRDTSLTDPSLAADESWHACYLWIDEYLLSEVRDNVQAVLEAGSEPYASTRNGAPFFIGEVEIPCSASCWDKTRKVDPMDIETCHIFRELLEHLNVKPVDGAADVSP
jgi:hypothetical protein